MRFAPPRADGLGSPLAGYALRHQSTAPHRRVAPGTVLVTLCAIAVAVWVAWGFYSWTRVDLEVAGLDDGAILRPLETAGLVVDIELGDADDIEHATIEFDGRPLEGLTQTERGYRWQIEEALPEGFHVLEVRVPRPVLAPAVFRTEFTVDGTAPPLRVPAISEPVAIDEPTRIRGTTERGAEVTVDGEPIDVDDDGRFEIVLRRPHYGPPMVVRAVDAAGIGSVKTVVTPVAYPEVRHVHVRAEDWVDPDVRDEVLSLLDEGKITAVELDVKDESGLVGHVTEVEHAREIGAAADLYDLEEAVELLHDHGAHVLVRIVAFNDTMFGRDAWARGARDLVIQNSDGSMLQRGEGIFLSFAQPEVRDYLRDLVLEVAAMGVDDIMFDYIRRPDGAIDDMRIPGLTTSAEEGIVDFLREMRTALREADRDVYLGAAVFGIAGKEPRGAREIAQDVRMMAPWLDYIAPMIYPSHFGRGEYGLPVPNDEPGPLIERSLVDFQELVADRGTALVPWLQDFSYAGRTYGHAEVRAQIDASCSLGVLNHGMWNARSSYTTSALGRCP